MKHSAKRIDDGEYEYRGYTIRRDDDTPTGYWGRWYSVPRIAISDTLRSVKHEIDKKLDKKKEVA